MRMLTFSSKNVGGGSIIKLLELITALSYNGWEVDYISPKDFEHTGLINHHPVINVPKFNGFFYLLQITFISLYLILIKKRNIDRILSFSILEGVVACLVSKFSNNTKVIVSVRADWFTGVQLAKWNNLYKKIYIKLFLKFEKFVFDKSDLIIFVSNENYLRISGRTKISAIKAKIVYNSVNNPRSVKFSDIQKVEFKEDMVIGFVGNLYAKDKGVEVLIQAYHKVFQKFPNTKLVIIGDGPDKEYLRNLCKSLNLEQNVLFTGRLHNPFPYIKAIDLMVHPSLHEGFSGAILEGLYCDKVVIGSKVGGIPEALMYEELLFNPNEINEIVSKIENLFNEESYQKALKLCNNRKIAFTFDWIREMEQLIENPN